MVVKMLALDWLSSDVAEVTVPTTEREVALRAVLATTGQKRLILPDEVAHAVLSLCDDAARAINGQSPPIAEGKIKAVFTVPPQRPCFSQYPR